MVKPTLFYSYFTIFIYISLSDTIILAQMSGTFSGIVRISNISDFIEPSQVWNLFIFYFINAIFKKCVLPIQNGRNQADEGKNLVVLHPKSQIKAQEKVKISLNDCLACSGLFLSTLFKLL